MVDRFIPSLPELKSITEMGMVCPKCDWTGTVYSAEPDVDGDGSLGCPKCLTIVTPDEKHKLYLEYTKKQQVAFDWWQKRKMAAEKKYHQKIQDATDWYNKKAGKLIDK